jgi:hypothetical protein
MATLTSEGLLSMTQKCKRLFEQFSSAQLQPRVLQMACGGGGLQRASWEKQNYFFPEIFITPHNKRLNLPLTQEGTEESWASLFGWTERNKINS